jgi:hypothetical protein
VSAYVVSSKNLKDLKDKHFGSTIKKMGEVLAYVGSIQNLKDLKDSHRAYSQSDTPIQQMVDGCLA